MAPLAIGECTPTGINAIVEKLLDTLTSILAVLFHYVGLVRYRHRAHSASRETAGTMGNSGYFQNATRHNQKASVLPFDYDVLRFVQAFTGTCTRCCKVMQPTLQAAYSGGYLSGSARKAVQTNLYHRCLVSRPLPTNLLRESPCRCAWRPPSLAHPQSLKSSDRRQCWSPYKHPEGIALSGR